MSACLPAMDECGGGRQQYNLWRSKNRSQPLFSNQKVKLVFVLNDRRVVSYHRSLSSCHCHILSIKQLWWWWCCFSCFAKVTVNQFRCVSCASVKFPTTTNHFTCPGAYHFSLTGWLTACLVSFDCHLILQRQHVRWTAINNNNSNNRRVSIITNRAIKWRF